MSGIDVAAIVPHAPLLLPQFEHEEVEGAARRIRGAVLDLDLHKADVIIVVSPHGGSTGIYKHIEGNLDAFGVRGIEGYHHTDPASARELAGLLDWPLLDGSIDHGILVPLLMLPAIEIPIVGVTIDESKDLDEVVGDGIVLGKALHDIARDQTTVVLCSCHTSASLSARSPVLLPEPLRAEANEMEDRFIDALRRDIDEAADLLTTLFGLGRTCSIATLSTFTSLFPSTPANVIAYDDPVGVGYVVAWV